MYIVCIMHTIILIKITVSLNLIVNDIEKINVSDYSDCNLPFVSSRWCQIGDEYNEDNNIMFYYMNDGEIIVFGRVTAVRVCSIPSLKYIYWTMIIRS